MPNWSSSSEPAAPAGVERAVPGALLHPPATGLHPSPALVPAWLAPFAVRAVWSRAARVALPVGLLQAGINQGEFWLRGEFTAAVVTRSLLTPLVTLTVGLLAAGSTYRLAQQSPPARERTLRPS